MADGEADDDDGDGLAVPEVDAASDPPELEGEPPLAGCAEPSERCAGMEADSDGLGAELLVARGVLVVLVVLGLALGLLAASWRPAPLAEAGAATARAASSAATPAEARVRRRALRGGAARTR